MKTREQLKQAIETLLKNRKENTELFQNGEISAEEFINTSDSIDRKIAGWRSSTIYYLSKVCNRERKEMSNILSRKDEVDLYYTYIR